MNVEQLIEALRELPGYLPVDGDEVAIELLGAEGAGGHLVVLR